MDLGFLIELITPSAIIVYLLMVGFTHTIAIEWLMDSKWIAFIVAVIWPIFTVYFVGTVIAALIMTGVRVLNVSIQMAISRRIINRQENLVKKEEEDE